MGHLVLLGDSIFDNAVYVPGGPPVIEQLRQALPRDWQASLLAVDGNIVEDVPKQLKKLPAAATHLVVSAGGNNALGEIGVLNAPARTVGESLELVRQPQLRFQESYCAMLRDARFLRQSERCLHDLRYDSGPWTGRTDSPCRV